MKDLIKADKNYILNTYARFPVEIVSGKGAVCVDNNGKKYIDMGSGIGVNAFGYADEVWQKAVSEQAGKLQHTSNLYYTEPQVVLAKKLCEKTGMDKVFFANSGAESNECAIKVARKYAELNKGAKYYNIITLKNSFHGRTLTTLSATGQDVFHKHFNPLTGGFLYATANDIKSVEKLIKKNKCAGIMLEMVQGEGGVNPLSIEFVKGVKALCEKHNLVLIIDEVQTGNGRCGTLYSYMQFGIEPDVITTAKGLGGGLPIGACIVNKRVSEVLTYGMHGSTFGGNPVACAGAITVIDRLNEKFLEKVKEKSALIFETLSKKDGIESITGLGLMIGIKTVKPAKEVVLKCIENGVLCLTAKDKVRLLPPLNIDMKSLKSALKVIENACK
ncbi:MAG: aspartate aminotransferase family protein [Clostridia bacterium]|nr:aspartate aminotransferase family protein [Clostridia bacterium]